MRSHRAKGQRPHSRQIVRVRIPSCPTHWRHSHAILHLCRRRWLRARLRLDVRFHTEAKVDGAGNKGGRDQERKLDESVEGHARKDGKEHARRSPEGLLNAHVKPALATRNDPRKKSGHTGKGEGGAEWKKG